MNLDLATQVRHQLLAAVYIHGFVALTIKSHHRAGHIRKLLSYAFDQAVDLVDAGDRPAVVVSRLMLFFRIFYVVRQDPFQPTGMGGKSMENAQVGREENHPGKLTSS